MGEDFFATAHEKAHTRVKVRAELYFAGKWARSAELPGDSHACRLFPHYIQLRCSAYAFFSSAGTADSRERAPGNYSTSCARYDPLNAAS